MRLSTSLIQQLGVEAIQKQQNRLSKLQLHLATGNKQLTPADDPIAAVRTLDLQEEIRKQTQYQDNINTISNRLELEEVTLSGMTDILQRMRELSVRANNEASLRAEDKQYIAQELRQGLDQLLGLANSKNANGEYLFSGTLTHTQPYPDQPTPTEGYYPYQGNDSQRLIQIGPSRRLADGNSGTQVFERIETALIEPDEIIEGQATPPIVEVQKLPVRTLQPGSYYELQFGSVTLTAGPLDKDPTLAELVTSLQGDPDYAAAPFTIAEGLGSDAGKLVVTWNTPGEVNGQVTLHKQDNTFSFIDQLVRALEDPAATESSKTIISDAIYAFDNILERVNSVRASVGARLNTVDQQQQTNEQYLMDLKGTLSEIKDLDYAEAIGRFNLQQVALQAAQQAFIKVQNLSLFNYIR
ncbi:MAG TPA: flagellar hook-associated protein 3 [Methylothermaceae bacterium]|nr:flagellar hook-associated protein 3 [Methylothermaceae bacterium]